MRKTVFSPPFLAKLVDIHKSDVFAHHIPSIIGIRIVVLSAYPVRKDGWENIHATIWDEFSSYKRGYIINFWAVKYVNMEYTEAIKQLENNGAGLSEYIL